MKINVDPTNLSEIRTSSSNSLNYFEYDRRAEKTPGSRKYK